MPMALPSTMIRAREVRLVRAAAMRLGDGMSPYADWWCSLTAMPSNPSWSAYSSSSRYREYSEAPSAGSKFALGYVSEVDSYAVSKSSGRYG
jgi:hypothetical protein